VSEQSQLGLDPRGTPGRILTGHASNELTDLCGDPQLTALVRARLPALVEPEARVVSSDDGVWLDDRRALTPAGPQLAEPDLEDSISLAQSRTLHAALEDATLMTQR
jgi:hypothetical protein